MGAITKQLEERFSSYVGVPHAIAVSSASMGLLMSVGINTDSTSRVGVVTPLTFVSTVNALLHNGCTPLFVDVDRRTQCMDVETVKEVLDVSDPFLVIPVHFAGYPCDVYSLIKYRAKMGKDFMIIEDCAHAVETTLGGVHAGGAGDLGVFSFNPTKNIAAPEMGMVVTGDRRMAESLQSLRLHGMDVSTYDRVNRVGTYDVKDLGFKANCTDIEALFTLYQLESVYDNYHARELIWGAYVRELGGLSVGLPVDWPNASPEGFHHGLHLFTVYVGNRDRFIAKMKERGVYCGIHYKPVHLFSYYRRRFGYREDMFPNAEWIGAHTCSLPLGPGMDEDDIGYVVDNFKAVYGHGGYECED